MRMPSSSSPARLRATAPDGGADGERSRMGWARAQGVWGARIGRRIEATMAARLAAAVKQLRRTGAELGRGVVMGGEVDSFACVIIVFLV